MKRLKVLSMVVLIQILCLSGLSKEQSKEGETSDDLLIKFIEYFNKKHADKATDYLLVIKVKELI